MASDHDHPTPEGAGADPTLADRTGAGQVEFDIAFFDAVLQREPDYVDVLRCQGELLTRKGEHDRALVVDRRLARLLPDDPFVFYNLACSLALVGQRAEAIAALRHALQQGYADFEHLDQDSDLDALRDEPAFVAILAEQRRAE